MFRDNPTLLLEILEQSPDAFVYYGPDHRLEHCNGAFAEWFFPGWTPEALVGRSFEEIIEICYACGRIATCNGIADWRAERLSNHRSPGQPYQYRLVDGRIIQGRERALSMGGILNVLTNITEHEKLVEDRAVSDLRYRQLFENAAVGVFRSSREGSFLEVNPALARMQGCATTEQHLSHFHASRRFYVDPQTRDLLLERLDREGAVRDFEAEILTKDGAPIWISETSHPVRDVQGRIVGYEGFIIDITARRRAEIQRDRSEARFRDFAELAADWFWETDLEQRFTWHAGTSPPSVSVSRQGANLVGLTRWDLFSAIGADSAIVSVVADHMRHGEPFSDLTYRYQDAKRGVTWVRFSGKPVYDDGGALVAYRGVGSDITEEKQVETARSQSDAQLRHAAEMGMTGHWVWDEENDRCIDCSESLSRFSGVPREEFIGLSHGEVRPFIHPEDWEEYHRQMSQFYATGEGFETAFRSVTADGEIRWVREIGERIPGPDGRLTYSIGTLQDITQERQMQEELRNAKELLQSQLDSSPLAIVTIDREGRMTSWNPAAEEIFGYTAEEALGTSATIPLHRYNAEREELRRRLRLGEAIRGHETTRSRKDGSEIIVSMNAAPLTTESGAYNGAVFVIADITEKKRAEASRARVDAQLRHATQIAMIAHWVWDERSGRCIDCSETMEHFTGLAKEDYIGLLQDDVDSLVHPDDWAPYCEIIERFDETGEHYEAVYRTIPEEGVVRWVREIGERIPGPDGSLSLSIGTLQDITEDKRLQNELREAKEMLQSQLDSSPLGIITIDAGSRVVAWNPAAEKIFGWSAEEVIGKPSPQIPPEREHERKELHDMVARGESVRGIETVRRHKDGRELHISISAAPLTSDAGAYSGAIYVIADITERKRLEAEVQKQEALALHAQKLEAVATLASGIAHDFNNMLLPIMIAAENLMESLPPDTPGHQEAEQILTTAERVAELVRRLLDFSRAEQPIRRRTDICTAVAHAIPLVKATLPSSVELEIAYDEPCGEVEIDTGQLLQVLLNLVGNAADAQNHRGRIRVALDTVDLEEATLPGLGTAQPGRHARLSVTDQGCGIAPDVLPQIFVPFYTTKEVGKGTGLGLAVSHGIVVSHGGGIDVESEEGCGTTFKVYFPLLERAESADLGRQAETNAA